MKKGLFFISSIMFFFLLLSAPVSATMITYDIRIDQILSNTLEVGLEAGDIVGHFSFDNSVTPLDRIQGNDSIVVDRFVTYDSASNLYSGAFDAYFDADYYQLEFSNEYLPFQFNLDENSIPMTFGGGGIYFDGPNKTIRTDSFYIWDEFQWFPSDMGNNQIAYNRNDLDFFVFTYSMDVSADDPTIPTPEPSSIILLLVGTVGFVHKKKKIIKNLV